MTHVKVKFIRNDIEEIIDPSRLVWCPAPYELPCQSLFFALLKYKEISDQLNWIVTLNDEGRSKIETTYTRKLESFRFVHLDNIKRQMNNDEPVHSSAFERATAAMEVDDNCAFKTAANGE